MNNTLEKQLKLLDFIKDTLTNKEGEQYYVRRIHLYHPFYTFFGSNHYIGSVLLICNETYNNATKTYTPNQLLYGPWIDRNHVDWEVPIDNQVMACQGFPKQINSGFSDMKTVLIKYGYSGDCYSFKKIMNLKKVKKQFPYIIDSLELLLKDRINNIDLDQSLELLSNDIEKHSKVKTLSL